MRLFIAAELPTQLIEALAETTASLRACVRGRFVAPDSLHVTLAFLGNVEASRVDDSEEAIAVSCQGIEPFSVSLGDLGSFGRRSSATLWQGFRESGRLPDMARTIRGELDARNLPYDDKAFLPHITLMRAANLSTGAISAPVIASGEIDAITLFESDLSGQRPIYNPLYRHLLK